MLHVLQWLPGTCVLYHRCSGPAALKTPPVSEALIPRLAEHFLDAKAFLYPRVYVTHRRCQTLWSRGCLTALPQRLNLAADVDAQMVL